MVSFGTVMTFLEIAHREFKENPKEAVSRTAASLGTAGTGTGAVVGAQEGAKFIDQHKQELDEAESAEEVAEVVFQHAADETNVEDVQAIVEIARRENLL